MQSTMCGGRLQWKIINNMKYEETKMSFVYEMVGEENRELWESIGWKDVFESPLDFYRKDYWSIDRINEIFLIAIGRYIDTPHYYDMSYKQRIIRMEIVERIESAANDKVKIIWDIYNIYIPKSVWLEKEKIIIAIKSAFLVLCQDLVQIKMRGSAS